MDRHLASCPQGRSASRSLDSDAVPPRPESVVARGVIHPTAFIASTAAVMGDVTLGEDASVWYGAVLRGDMASIVIGPQSNIQDGTVVHVDDGIPCVVG